MGGESMAWWSPWGWHTIGRRELRRNESAPHGSVRNTPPWVARVLHPPMRNRDSMSRLHPAYRGCRRAQDRSHTQCFFSSSESVLGEADEDRRGGTRNGHRNSGGGRRAAVTAAAASAQGSAHARA